MDVLIRFNPNISHSCFAYRVHIWSLLIHFQVMFWMDWFFGKVIYVETSKQNRKTTCKTDLTNDFRFGCKKDSSQTIQYAQKFRIKYHLWDNWKHFSLKLRFSKPNSTLETHWKKIKSSLRHHICPQWIFKFPCSDSDWFVSCNEYPLSFSRRMWKLSVRLMLCMRFHPTIRDRLNVKVFAFCFMHRFFEFTLCSVVTLLFISALSLSLWVYAYLLCPFAWFCSCLSTDSSIAVDIATAATNIIPSYNRTIFLHL